MWKAVIKEVRDIGNGTGDVTVEFFNDSVEAEPVRKIYNFHAGQTTLESGTDIIMRDLKAFSDFEELSKQVQGFIGKELVLESK